MATKNSWATTRPSDVMIRGTTPVGDERVLSIETNYHENLRTSTTVHERTLEVAEQTEFGHVNDDSPLQRSPLVQVLLDHLLACS